MTPEEFKAKQDKYLKSLCLLKDMPAKRKVVLSQEACSLLELDMSGEFHVGVVADDGTSKQVSPRCVTTASVLREKIAAAGHELKSPMELLKEEVVVAAVSDEFKRPVASVQKTVVKAPAKPPGQNDAKPVQ